MFLIWNFLFVQETKKRLQTYGFGSVFAVLIGFSFQNENGEKKETGLIQKNNIKLNWEVFCYLFPNIS